MQVSIPVQPGGTALAGDLESPKGARAVVLFAHGSGSSRHSPRNQFVARALQDRGLATLLTDLLTPGEEARDRITAEIRFDIGLLARRLVGIVDWMNEQPAIADLPVGLFGASTGGGAALAAAAARPDRIAAVVSRGGRPDLAGDALPKVVAPTLLVVGGYDQPVIDLNHRAMRAMRAPVKLVIVPGASHLFEEPGTLDQVASLAADWFLEKAVAHAST